MKRTFTLFASLFFVSLCSAAEMVPIEYEKQTLANGMTVIYAPLHNAPVVHVRVLYHVGSRDEDPQRKGFAHMFEHMMFRGSTHVAPQQHMRLIGINGGDSNAFTKTDETTYINTLPSNNVEMALYLEADRMASFKVDDTIFQTERKVVAEEWRMRYANQPTGSLYQDFVGLAFQKHSYHWTPIGDMDQLRRATSEELQSFFNTYYVPNNACLVIAGDIDVAKTRPMVEKYFGWIPRGADIKRRAEAEPLQTEPRSLIAYKPNVPLTNIYLGFKTTDYKSDDHTALGVLGDILVNGRTGRLDNALVNTADAPCVEVGAADDPGEDQSLFLINAVLQQGRSPSAVQRQLLGEVYTLAEAPLTQAELDKVLVPTKLALIKSRQTATQIATTLGEEETFGGDANRVNEKLAKLEKLTPADVQAIAKKYFKPETLTVVEYRPDPTGLNARKAAATQAASAAAKANETKNAGVVPSTEPVLPRVTKFPEGYPTQPPVNPEVIQVTLNKGVEAKDNKNVITLTDHRLPIVGLSLVWFDGGDNDPAGKIGLHSMTSSMLMRGAGGRSMLDFSTDLESHGIEINCVDSGDNTRLTMTCPTDQLDTAIDRVRAIVTKPNLAASELAQLQSQMVGSVTQGLSSPTSVVDREIKQGQYGSAPQGQAATPGTLAAIANSDVIDCYRGLFPNSPLFVISGDVDADQGEKIASQFVKKLSPPSDGKDAIIIRVPDYQNPPGPTTRRVVVVDNPEGRQATIRFANHAFDIRSDDKYAGTVAGTILSSGIESRLNRYVRAEKGLTYGCAAFFRPGRHTDDFIGQVDTNPDTAAAAIEAMLKVFNDVKTAGVTDQELADAKTRVAGQLAMELQTIQQQANRRIDQILNGYPIDYYDQYPQHVAQVTADQVREVLRKYVNDDRTLFVCVAPAAIVKPQLESIGAVEVTPMPLQRPGVMPSTQP